MIPELRKEHGTISLYVDEKPYLALAGEVHNSSASSLTYMAEQVWPQVRKMNLNTLIVPIYWELIEPVEGEYVFDLLDGLLVQARNENMKLILLWFGLWKNGISTYVPAWVKTGYPRFWRARFSDGSPSEAISPLCREGIEADARAFSKVMQHLAEADGEEHTVIAVQVENEVGLLGEARDHSVLANQCFAQQIPESLSAVYGQGSWKTVFGSDAEESFMAFHYAAALEQIAFAGKQEYPLPMYANVWLKQHPDRPGKYPSGGPVYTMLPIWQKVAPSLDFIAPDIYLPQFDEVCAQYTRHENPLFIPEARQDTVTVSNLFYALGHYGALCYSPFAIEDLPLQGGEQDEEKQRKLLQMLNIESSAFAVRNTAGYLAEAYRLLGGLSELMAQNRGTKRLEGFLCRQQRGTTIEMDGCFLEITYASCGTDMPVPAGLVIQTNTLEFYIAAMSCSIVIRSCKGQVLDFLEITEGSMENGRWNPRRRLNGDERWLSFGSHPGLLHVVLYEMEP